MLTPVELFLNGFIVLVILPLAVASLVKGSQPPEGSFISKYYRAEPRLMLMGNLFLIALAATAILALARHFGLAQVPDPLEAWVHVPFLVLLVVFLGFFVRAVLKVRRAANAG